MSKTMEAILAHRFAPFDFCVVPNFPNVVPSFPNVVPTIYYR
jgi:hypothetical protein